MAKNIKRPSAARIAFYLWGLCVVLFLISIAVGTNLFRGTVDQTAYGSSKLFQTSSLVLILAGIFFFGLGILLVIFQEIYLKKTNRHKNCFGLFFKFLLWLTVLPLVEAIKTIRGKKAFRKKVLPLVFELVILLPVWVAGYIVAGLITAAMFNISAQSLGLVATEKNIVGTGSMYPTWPKGTPGQDYLALTKEVVATAGFLPYPNGLKIGNKRIFGHTLGRGDIITWENDATRELTGHDDAAPAGLMKRLIGLPGDTIELKDGIIYLNGQPQKEPYVVKARSTFGENFLKECQMITVPDGAIFAMGDNRKGSADSREIGFAPIEDIDFVIPFSKQKGTLDRNWHDPNNDLAETAKIRLEKEKYLELLNEKRKEAGVRPLKYQPKLEKSAGLRGKVILKYNDFSFEATRSGYTMGRAMSDSGYSNIVWGEAPTLGYFDAEELVENQFEFPESKKFFLENDYQEIGIAEVEGMLNDCPAQVLVQHFAGYVPPDYNAGDIESWEQTLARLREILPSWENIKNSLNLYRKHKDQADRILYIINLRISRIGAIASRMRANQWLTGEEKKFIEEDLGLYNEQQELAKILNSYNW